MIKLTFQRFTKHRNCISVYDGDQVIATITRQHDWDQHDKIICFKLIWVKPDRAYRFNCERWCFGTPATQVLRAFKKDIQARYNK